MSVEADQDATHVPIRSETHPEEHQTPQSLDAQGVVARFRVTAQELARRLSQVLRPCLQRTLSHTANLALLQFAEASAQTAESDASVTCTIVYKT